MTMKEQSLPILTLCTEMAGRPLNDLTEAIRRCLNILASQDHEARGARLYHKVMELPSGDRAKVMAAIDTIGQA